jgi:dihydroorotate dehydrogenase (fumarate)
MSTNKMMLMNASGCKCTTLEELEYLDSEECPVDAVVTKSCTLDSRVGNTEIKGKKTTWYSDIPHGSINSNGLCNLGVDAYIEYGKKRTSDKPYFISVAGTSLKEKIAMLRRIEANPGCCHIVELNFSCPNIKDDLDGEIYLPSWVIIDVGLQDIEKKFPDMLYGVKLPPLFGRYEWKKMAAVLNCRKNIHYVVCCNSIPNGFFPDEEGEGVIEPRGGFGGIGGVYLKPVSMANIKAYHRYLKPQIIIYGCGGVYEKQDVIDYQRCGAAGVQIGTYLMQDTGETIAEKFEKLRVS